MNNLTINPCFCLHCGSFTQENKDFCCSACEVLHQIKLHNWLPQNENQFESYRAQYLYMDHPDFKAYYESPSLESKNVLEAASEFTFFVEGLQCSSCVHLIEKLPEFYSEIRSAEINFGLSTLVIRGTKQLSLSQVMAILNEFGYKGWPLSPKENIVDRFKNENRTFIKRMAVAGACTGNIMLFVVPVYAGLTGTYATVFNWLSLLLFLPILLYSATPFYKGALNSIKYKVINVDLPITIALLAGFIFSTLNLFRGQGEIYFDSTASFIFLILSTRFMVKRVQQKSLSESSLNQFLPIQEISYRFSEKESGENKITTKPSHKINPGDQLIIKPNQIVPADGCLSSISADLDVSLLNGESLPQSYTQGMKVFAGTRVLNKPMEMIVDKINSDTEIGQIMTQLERESLQKTKFITLSDKLAQWLIVVVFSVAILFFIFYGTLFNYQTALNRSLALIVLACPCALAFGTPLTYAMALRRARDHGVLIKNGNVFEKILKMKVIFFDKTGTLTSGKLKLVQHFPNEISDEIKSLILGLEGTSSHPIAFSFRNAWKEITPTSLDYLEEKLGFGVFGRFKENDYTLEADQRRSDSGLLGVTLKKNNQALGYFYFCDELHPDTSKVIQELHLKKFKMGILSGDRKHIVQTIANETKIDPLLAYSELSPQDKERKIKEFENVCMIGDGANDALAMKASLVSIAVKGSVSLSLSSCDIYFTQPGLKSLLFLIDLSKKSQDTLRRNLFFALIYNFTGGVLALFGFINPLMAAILMPLSSAVILGSTLWGVRK